MKRCLLSTSRMRSAEVKFGKGRALPRPRKAVQQVSSPSNTDELSAVSRTKLTRCIDHVTDEIPNSPAQKGAPHQVSLPYSSTALAPSSFPSCPGSPILMDCALEGPPIAENHAHCWSDKEELTNQCRRTSFARYPATVSDRLGCRAM